VKMVTRGWKEESWMLSEARSLWCEGAVANPVTVRVGSYTGLMVADGK
jgi:hypothetical protein